MTEKISRALAGTFIAALAAKIMLSLAIPLTSDEAYFIVWGRHLDFGYYDHPPMVGWILHALLYLGDWLVLMRLPAILSTLFIGWGIWKLLSPRNREQAFLVTMLYLISPFNILNVLITTDTPLIFFAFASFWSLVIAERGKKMPWYLLSGLLLGCAFLSKYFAVLLGAGYAVYWLFTPRDARRTAGFAVLFAAVIPFAALNLYWNYTHCWVNILFNVFNRNRQETFSFGKVASFVAVQAYLMLPPVCYYLVRNSKTLWRTRAELLARFKESGLALSIAAFMIPLAAFAFLSLKKSVGLHWVLGFYPFYYVMLFFLLDEGQLTRSLRFMFYFTLVHLLAVGTILSMPIQTFRQNKNYDLIVMGTRPQRVLALVRPYMETFHLATPSYSDSALLSYHARRYFSVFGGGSHHARQDDMLTDFSALDGKDILILKTSAPGTNEYSSFFRNIEVSAREIDGATYYLVFGYGFNFAQYRDLMLADIRGKYYAIPPFLPVKPGSCYFYDRYFPELLKK